MSASCNSGRGLSPLLGTIFNVWLYYNIEWYFIKNEHNRPFKCESVLVWCTKRSTCHDSFSSLDKRQPIPRLQSRCRTLKKCGRRASNCTLANLGIDGWQEVDNSQKKNLGHWALCLALPGWSSKAARPLPLAAEKEAPKDPNDSRELLQPIVPSGRRRWSPAWFHWILSDTTCDVQRVTEY